MSSRKNPGIWFLDKIKKRRQRKTGDKPDLYIGEPVEAEIVPKPQPLVNSGPATHARPVPPITYARSLGTTSLVLSLVGLVCAIIFMCVPVVSIPFSVLGLVFGALGLGFGLAKKKPGLGFSFALTGTILSILALIVAGFDFWFFNQPSVKNALLNVNSAEKTIPRSTHQVVGVWRFKDEPKVEIQFTSGGSFIYTNRTRERKIEKFGQYSIFGKRINIREESRSSISRSADHIFEVIQDDELLIQESRSYSQLPSVKGRWVRVPGTGYAAAKKDTQPSSNPTKSKYESDLASLVSKQEDIQQLLKKLEENRTTIVQKLKRLKEENAVGNEDWLRAGKELKFYVDKIAQIESDKVVIDRAIDSLETVIRTEESREAVEKYGITKDGLRKILKDKYDVNDELDKKANVDSSTDQVVDDLIESELEHDAQNSAKK